MRKPLIIGNWKMNTSLDEARALAEATVQASDDAANAAEVGICPPFPWLVPVSRIADGTSLRIGAQDCAATTNGAFTGDVSADMLASCCSFTLIGHSERRAHHHETDEVVRDKIHNALGAGLGVILCVGETMQQREGGYAADIVTKQLDIALDRVPNDAPGRLSVAYEPVWAIGTGNAATAQDASEMALTIRRGLTAAFGNLNDRVRILYGGSANDTNAADFLGVGEVDGLLVGGASLKPEVFASMIEASRHG